MSEHLDIEETTGLTEIRKFEDLKLSESLLKVFMPMDGISRALFNPRLSYQLFRVMI